MPTRKRRRPTSAADDGNAALPLLVIEGIELVSLEDFAVLPAEVQQHIVELSCLVSASSSSPTSRSLFSTDTPTAMSLCLASKGLNSLATPSLYRDVVITRPSALYFLQRTLKTHPERAKLTRRLHLGPLDALPEGWWPLTNAFLDGDGWQPTKNVLGTAYTWIKTSLGKAQLPSHYDANHSWALSRPLAGCREAAIREALQSAQAALDVNVRVEGQRIATSRVAAIMEVQAALDVYLESCKRIEDGIEEVRKVAQPGARVPLQCRNGQCSHYCALDIWGTSHRCSRPCPPAGVYSCSRNDLLRHLARPGSPTDRFDHPLVFARSGFDVSVNPALGKGHQYHSTPGTGTHWRLVGDTFFDDEDRDWPDLASLQKDAERSWLWESDEDWAPRNEILINTGTIGQTLRLARSVLAALVNVEDLSLSGFLERVLDGKQNVSNVRCLSLGPPPPYWDVSISLGGLDRLEQLHLCEIPATEGELRPFIDELFHLRKVYWSLSDSFPRPYLSRLGTTIRDIIKREWTPLKRTKMNMAIEARKREAGKESAGQDDSDDGRSAGQPCPSSSPASSEHEALEAQPETPNDALIIAKLRPTVVDEVLSQAPSPDVADAWQQGRATASNRRRLHLQETSLFLSGGGLGCSSQSRASRVWNALYEEVWAWWRGDRD